MSKYETQDPDKGFFTQLEGEELLVKSVTWSCIIDHESKRKKPMLPYTHTLCHITLMTFSVVNWLDRMPAKFVEKAQIRKRMFGETVYTRLH